MCGAINHDSLIQKEPEAIIDVSKMRQIKDWLKNWNMPYEKKRLLWCVFTFMFLGSLRPSKILSHRSQEFDPTKCLLTKDLKWLKARVDGQE